MGVISCGTTMLDQGLFENIGAVSWDTTAKTATFTAVSGEGYFVNTTAGAITVTLPAGSAGAIVSVADYAATWQTNNVTVTPNGTDKIGGTNTGVSLNTEGQSVTFFYVDSTQGWINTMDSTSNVRGNNFVAATGGTETTSGDYKIHTFTGPGTLCVSNAGNPIGSTTVDYLVVAGGGGGGGRGPSGQEGGGGGAGGYRESSGAASGCYSTSPLGSGVSALPVSVTGYPITVGAGGSGGLSPSPGSAGANSIFSTITSAGGGGAAGTSPLAGNPGGSGGGANFGAAGGSGNQPPVSPPQGNNGSNFVTPAKGGGGGGATSASSSSANGGNGGQSSINGSATYRGGGGGGSPGGTGGLGGGADGVSSPGGGNAGTANTGGGGSGALFAGCGGAAGSGIVIIRYKFQ